MAERVDHLLLWIHNKGCSAGAAEEEEGAEHQDAEVLLDFSATGYPL
jgi:hypothetical protein